MTQFKILLIEDHETTRLLYDTMLKKSGFTVDTAINGIDGLHLAQQGGYDLILMDMMLPLMDGLTILSTLRTTPPTSPNGPIVVSSNLANDQIFDKAKQLGASDYIVKSDITPIEVVERVKKILKV